MHKLILTQSIYIENVGLLLPGDVVFVYNQQSNQDIQKQQYVRCTLLPGVEPLIDIPVDALRPQYGKKYLRKIKEKYEAMSNDERNQILAKKLVEIIEKGKWLKNVKK